MRFLFLVLVMFSESVLAGTLVFGPGVHNLAKPVVINTDNSDTSGESSFKFTKIFE